MGRVIFLTKEIIQDGDRIPNKSKVLEIKYCEYIKMHKSSARDQS